MRNTSNPHIKLQASSETSSVVIEIEDNGSGTTEKDLKRIFEPFYTTKIDGTGLGLYVVKQLVDRNNAVIQVENGNLSGLCFKIMFKKP